MEQSEMQSARSKRKTSSHMCLYCNTEKGEDRLAKVGKNFKAYLPFCLSCLPNRFLIFFFKLQKKLVFYLKHSKLFLTYASDFKMCSVSL